MKFATRAVLITLGMSLLYGCSSMTFIPPDYSLATTAYVNNKITRQKADLQHELMLESKATIDSLLFEDRQRLSELKEKVKQQQAQIENAVATLDSIEQASGRVDFYVNKLRDDVSRIESTNDDLQQSYAKFQSELDQLPNRTLKKMLQAIEQTVEDESGGTDN